MSDQAVLLPKRFSHGGITLAKGKLDHSYDFWTMSNYTNASTWNFFGTDITTDECSHANLLELRIHSSGIKMILAEFKWE